MGQRPGTDPNKWIPKCNATRRDGEPCTKRKLKDRNVCEEHGGLTPRGMASPHYEHGRYVASLKGTKLGEKVERAYSDPTLQELTGEVALLQGIIEMLCDRFSEEGGQAEGIGTVKAIKKMYKEMVLAGVKKEWGVFNHLLEELGKAIEAAEQQFAIIEEIKGAVRVKKDLVDSQTKRELQLENHMKAEEVLIFKDILLQANRNILFGRLNNEQDADAILAEIAGEFGRITGERNPRRLNAATSEE